MWWTTKVKAVTVKWKKRDEVAGLKKNGKSLELSFGNVVSKREIKILKSNSQGESKVDGQHKSAVEAINTGAEAEKRQGGIYHEVWPAKYTRKDKGVRQPRNSTVWEVE